MNYKVLIMYDEEYKGYVVDVPELTGCMSQGKTIDEAIVNVKDAIKGWLKTEKKHKKNKELNASVFKDMFLGQVTV